MFLVVWVGRLRWLDMPRSIDLLNHILQNEMIYYGKFIPSTRQNYHKSWTSSHGTRRQAFHSKVLETITRKQANPMPASLHQCVISDKLFSIYWPSSWENSTEWLVKVEDVSMWYLWSIVDSNLASSDIKLCGTNHTAGSYEFFMIKILNVHIVSET